MPEQSDVKIFVSWSGDLAKAVAVALRTWLPLLFDRVEPWASDTDIAAGQRGLQQIEVELQDSRFGIVVVTAENQNSAWLNFEAGALSKTVMGDLEHRVVPLLVDLTGPTQLDGPLRQFQAKLADREGVGALIASIASVAGIDPGVAEARFEVYWPVLERKLEAAKSLKARPTPGGAAPQRDQSEILDEVLLHVRAIRSAAEARPGNKRERDSIDKAFDRWIDKLAEKHGLAVFEFPAPRGSERRIVGVRPAGEYSEQKAAEFRAEFEAGVAAIDRDVEISFVPF